MVGIFGAQFSKDIFTGLLDPLLLYAPNTSFWIYTNAGDLVNENPGGLTLSDSVKTELWNNLFNTTTVYDITISG